MIKSAGQVTEKNLQDVQARAAVGERGLAQAKLDSEVQQFGDWRPTCPAEAKSGGWAGQK